VWGCRPHPAWGYAPNPIFQKIYRFFDSLRDAERILPVACRKAAGYILMALVEKVEELLIILRLFVFNLQN